MSDREGSRSADRKGMARDRSPHARREESPRNHKAKSFSRSPSRGGKVYREEDRERERRRDSKGERRYRSRSRSHSSKRYKTSKYSRSRSRSGGYRGRSHSRSPMSSRRRHTGTRDNPKPSRCLGVFGLSVHTSEEDIFHIFAEYGPIDRVQVVIDAKTGRSRGFSFVYFKNTEDAKVAKEHCAGMKINGKNIRVDYSITERAHTPTPGIYMGKPTTKFSDRYDRRRERDDYYGGRSRYHRRSQSPYYRRRRYDRSRSRSYSPRRY
ncbi:transformer-2 protein homolog beta-like isoform X2 [Coccinella septempunctata]|uniref:transformer-2 protein homolog beta-like isoform X2 n=1 Tax=Coccinella septempunctata TaxID=41139 RepID=UPI001D0619A7|nr:transformer-2 protein homolog beta-like isoform X2 [Coccinella septempunctata]